VPSSGLQPLPDKQKPYEQRLGSGETGMGDELTIIRKPVPPTSPTLRDILAVLFRQRRLALVFFVATFLAVLGYGVFMPSYEAHMNVLVRRGRVDPLVTPAPTPSPMFQRDEISEEELNSQVELLRDEEILRTVVQAAGQAGSSWYERFLGGSQDVQLARAVRRMTRRLTVEPIRKTNLIQVAYSSSDPAQAAAVLHSLERAYLERQQRVRRPSGEYEFFEQQVAQSRRGLLDAEFRLMDFRKKTATCWFRPMSTWTRQ
jgi:polysaccharide biosynthesis transport protein